MKPAPSGLPWMGRVMYHHGQAVHRVRWLIVALWIVLVVIAVPFALRAPSALQGGGYFNINSEAVDVEHVVSQQFHQPLSQVLVVFRSSTVAVNDPAYQREIDTMAARARGFRHVTSVVRGSVSADGRSTYLAVGFDHDPDYMQRDMPDFRARLPHEGGGVPARAYLTGTPAVYDTLTAITVEDVERADATALPIALVVLLVVFATAVAATMPILLGITAVPAALAIIYAIALRTPTTSFILSVASIIGLGISIDYSLLITRRFREELGRGRTVSDAVGRTMATAGEAILFSGLTVMIGFLGLLAIEVPITTSFAIGGVVVVAAALLAALTLLPALLSILGPRVNAMRIPILHRRSTSSTQGARGVWHAWALTVMRHPLIAILVVLALLAGLGWPAITLRVGVPGADVLPASSSERQGLAILRQQFPDLASDPIYVVARTRDGSDILTTPDDLRQLDNLAEWVSVQRHVTGVVSLTHPQAGSGGPALSGSQLVLAYASGQYRQVPALTQLASAVVAGDTTLIVARSDTAQDSAAGRALIDQLRHFAPVATTIFDVHVGGMQALSQDLDSALYRNFPRTILLVLTATFLLLLVMFRSVLLPLKAVVMNTLSVAATFGALVYVFQWGGLGFPRVEFIDAIIPILLFCALFGLSMDYEVFLLSRIREEWLRTGDNEAAVARGLERTAGVITSAAFLFTIVTGAFTFATLVTTQEIGVGMTVAVLVDATVVRLLLVPATMRMLGPWNWWLPRIRRRRQRSPWLAA